ncbi:hypothetical protein CMI42_05155 [Candidatus Pacearchaeota archaeon]|jgi:hypothetical protein|nr:hypothetical protein [Candidatus Pacearchaeota archaeon]|tara:strand:+ start:2389 stop:2994 length:606 start_codon:yes stop_codon:yes gene_type:complete
MGWFSRKKKDEEVKLPELSGSSELPRLPDLNDNALLNADKVEGGLPDLKVEDHVGGDSIGGGGNVESLGSSMIAEGKVSPPPVMHDDKNEVPILAEPVSMIEERMDEPMMSKPMESQPLPSSSVKGKSSSKEIYVRLDKFQTTQDAIEEIKEKIMEVEKTLDKIKGIKDKEEKELHDWEREIGVMKSKIDFIDSNLFSKVG